jgi:hypothetical protein
MLTDAVSWVFHSPRRLAVTAVVILAVVLLGGNALFGGGGGRGNAKDGGPRPAATAQVPDAGPYVDAAVAFVEKWSPQPKNETTEQWAAKLASLTTPEFGEALATTNTAELPDSPPRGDPVVRYVADSSALVAVPLANGSSVLVTLVDGDQRVLVSDIQPNVGD